jgi:hypothetical protein
MFGGVGCGLRVLAGGVQFGVGEPFQASLVACPLSFQEGSLGAMA